MFTVSGVKAYSEVSQVQLADWPPTSDGHWPAPASGPQQSDDVNGVRKPHLKGDNDKKLKGDWKHVLLSTQLPLILL